MMKEKIKVKIVAIKKGTPKKRVEELLCTISAAWSETHPGEQLYCIPVQMDKIPKKKELLHFPPQKGM